MARKPNKNCLEGVACPKCGQEEHFKIVAGVLVIVSDDGTEDCGGDYEWDENSFTNCPECGHDGNLLDFTIDHWPEEKLAWLEQLRKEDDDEGA